MLDYENLSLIGFEFQLIENRYLRFHRHEARRVLIIGGGDMEYLTIKNINCSIKFNQIEDFFEPNQSEFPRTFSLINHNQILNSSLGEHIIKDKYPFKINKHEMHLTSELFSYFYKSVASPFFDRWNDIRKLLPYLEFEFDDNLSLSRIFKLNGMLNKMIVWKLCGHPKTNEYITYHSERIKSISEMDESKQYTKAIKEFERIRDKILKADQEYEWNEKYLNVKENGY